MTPFHWENNMENNLPRYTALLSDEQCRQLRAYVAAGASLHTQRPFGDKLDSRG